MGSIILGVNIYDARGATGERQARALASLVKLRDVQVVNLQFHDEVPLPTPPGCETHCVLREDSVRITGRRGARKPIVSEMLGVLGRIANARGARYIAIANSDIVVTQEAIDWMLRERMETYAISRQDVDIATREPLGIQTRGVDFFTIASDWWRGNSHRFRPYILGNHGWDAAYASKMMCHSRGVVVNDRPLVLHDLHEMTWGDSPFGLYNQTLLTLDSPYFSLWVHYTDALDALRAGPHSVEDELALQSRMFRFRPTLGARAYHIGRTIRARARYLMLNRASRA